MGPQLLSNDVCNSEQHSADCWLTHMPQVSKHRLQKRSICVLVIDECEITKYQLAQLLKYKILTLSRLLSTTISNIYQG